MWVAIVAWLHAIACTVCALVGAHPPFLTLTGPFRFIALANIALWSMWFGMRLSSHMVGGGRG